MQCDMRFTSASVHSPSAAGSRAASIVISSRRPRSMAGAIIEAVSQHPTDPVRSHEKIFRRTQFASARMWSEPIGRYTRFLDEPFAHVAISRPFHNFTTPLSTDPVTSHEKIFRRTQFASARTWSESIGRYPRFLDGPFSHATRLFSEFY